MKWPKVFFCLGLCFFPLLGFAGSKVRYGHYHGYLALPKTLEPRPALIMVHDQWGLNDHVKSEAEKFAAQDYVVLAVDLYQGKVPSEPNEAKQFKEKLITEDAQQNLLRAVNVLKHHRRVKKGRIGVLGWGLGGAQSLKLAMSSPDLKVVVDYYGLSLEPSELKKIKAQVIGIFGEKDQSISPSTVKAFDHALGEAHVDHEIHVYPDSSNSFANPTQLDAYNPKTAALATKVVSDFLKKHLSLEN